jgi:hypothetical protein
MFAFVCDCFLPYYSEIVDLFLYVFVAAVFPDLFTMLDTKCGPLSLHTSIPDLVRYVQLGLYHVKHDT